jgi:hypothetical protein
MHNYEYECCQSKHRYCTKTPPYKEKKSYTVIQNFRFYVPMIKRKQIFGYIQGLFGYVQGLFGYVQGLFVYMKGNSPYIVD